MAGELYVPMHTAGKTHIILDISRFIVWGDKPEQIGTGGFGNVYKCSMSGQPVAVKVLRARSYINECDGPEEHALTALKRVYPIRPTRFEVTH
jgi:predicted Ser/Thr protein kinase